MTNLKIKCLISILILKNNPIKDMIFKQKLKEIEEDIVPFGFIDDGSDQIKRIMKQNISFGSYKKWRERVKKFSKRRMHYK